MGILVTLLLGFTCFLSVSVMILSLLAITKERRDFTPKVHHDILPEESVTVVLDDSGRVWTWGPGVTKNEEEIQ